MPVLLQSKRLHANAFGGHRREADQAEPGGLRGTDRRVHGTAAESAASPASRSASRTAAAGTGRVDAGRGIRARQAGWHRAARPVAGVAASTSDRLSCRCGALPGVGSDIWNNDGRTPTVPIWAENPLRVWAEIHLEIAQDIPDSRFDQLKATDTDQPFSTLRSDDSMSAGWCCGIGHPGSTK